MEEEKYVISGTYTIQIMTDGCQPSYAGSEEVEINLDHEDALFMGEYFYDEDPREIGDGPDLNLRAQVEARIVDEVGEYNLWGYCFLWPDALKEECVNYFKEHTDRELDEDLWDDDDEEEEDDDDEEEEDEEIDEN